MYHCTIVVFQETHAHAIDEIELLRGSRDGYDYIVPRPKLQRMDCKCICGRGTAAALNTLLADYYTFQLSFRFSFPFQFSVSAFHFSFQFPPFPLALSVVSSEAAVAQDTCTRQWQR